MDEHQQAIQRKYADKTTPEIRASVEAIGLCSRILAQHREQYEELLKSKQYADSVGWAIDPTLYRDLLSSKSFPLQERMVKAALAFLNEIDAVKAEFEKLEAPDAR